MVEVIGGDGRIKDSNGIAPQGAVISVYKSANQTAGNAAVVTFDVEAVDPYGWWSTSTNRFQPLVPGYYRFSWAVRDAAPTGWSMTALRKNGTETYDGTFQNSANPGSSHGSAIVYLNGTTDYVDFQHLRSDATNGTLFGGGPQHSYVHIDLVGTSVGVVPDPRQAAAFQTGWSNHPTASPLTFRKNPDGVVQMQGLAYASSSFGFPSNIIVLPATHRPYQDCRSSVLAFDATGSAYKTVYVSVLAGSGVVEASTNSASVGSAGGMSGASGSWISLDGVSWMTA